MTENSSEPIKIFEPDSPEELLRGWLRHSHKGRQRHDMAAQQLDRVRIFLGATATAFAVVVGTSVFAALEKLIRRLERHITRNKHTFCNLKWS